MAQFEDAFLVHFSLIPVTYELYEYTPSWVIAQNSAYGLVHECDANVYISLVM